VRESRPQGSVRGVPGNRHLYRDKREIRAAATARSFHFQGLTPPLFPHKKVIFQDLTPILCAASRTSFAGFDQLVDHRLEPVSNIGCFYLFLFFIEASNIICFSKSVPLIFLNRMYHILTSGYHRPPIFCGTQRGGCLLFC
jgi:hypothetical protein